MAEFSITVTVDGVESSTAPDCLDSLHKAIVAWAEARGVTVTITAARFDCEAWYQAITEVTGYYGPGMTALRDLIREYEAEHGKDFPNVKTQPG